MSEINRDIATQVIRMLASVINNTELDGFDGDWEKLIEFSKEQSVLNLVAYAVDNMKDKPDAEMCNFLSQIRKQKMLTEAVQEIEAGDVFAKLEEMGVKYMPLKGFIVKNLYPSPDMRTMSDIDVIIDKNELRRVVDAFVNDGFSYVGEGDLHANVSRGKINLEFHHAMVDEKYTKLNEYYGDGFKLAKPVEGSEYRYELSKEDLYVFLIVHIAKHYQYGGTGIRTLLDIYVYEKAIPELDYDYINGELKKIGLDKFYEKLRKIVYDWFSGNFDGNYDSVSAYIVAGGVYGVQGIQKLNHFINENMDNLEDARKKTAVENIFPPLEIMQIRYPVLNKQKWLLPLFWIVRIIQTLIQNPENAKGRFKNTADLDKIDEDMISAQRESLINNAFE